MDIFKKIKDVWHEQVQLESDRSWIKRLNQGELGLEHYRGFLVETYHNTAYNPQIQAFATMYIKNNPRDLVKKFYMHAISEIGHDLLAMNDLSSLGVTTEHVKATRALPTTKSLFTHAVYQIQFNNPICYLGYLYHLEQSPVENGNKMMAMLKSKGIPENAMSFIEEHAKVDISHLKMMESYLMELVKTDEDFSLLSHAVRDTVTLHTRMLEGAFENGEKNYKF